MGKPETGGESGLGSGSRAAARLCVILPLTLAFSLGLLALKACRPRARSAFRLWYYRAVCRVAGVQLDCRGQLSDRGPTLVVANHVSYLDIAVLGALVDGNFVSRADVARWPLIGWSARLQGTVFIDRRVRGAREHLDGIAARLAHGDKLILFPEGTSSDGQRVLPFKSTLFAAAELTAHNLPVQVQPVSIAYTKLDGVPMGRYLRPFFAWYGDMSFWSHLWQLLSLGKATVVLVFHDSVTLADFGNRKRLSEHCHKKVSLGVAAALSGHDEREEDIAAATAVA